MGEEIRALILLAVLVVGNTTTLVAGEVATTAERTAHWQARQEDALARLARTSDDAVAWTDLGEAALMLGDAATAGSALTQAAAIRSPDARGRFLSGCLALKERRFDEAETEFTAAVTLQPEFTEARFFLGRACRYGKKLEAALDHFTAVLAARPDYVNARTYRIRVLQDLQRSAERDQEIAALHALRAAGHPALLQASAFRRDRIVVPGGAAAVLERFAGEPVRWRAITAAGGIHRELVVCRDGAGWMLAAVTDAGGVRLAGWEICPDYDVVRPQISTLLSASWPPTGERVAVDLGSDTDLDVGQ